MRFRQRPGADIIWDGMRALFEGARPTPELLGLISDRAAETIAFRAAKEGWDDQCPNPREARVNRMIDDRTEALSRLKPRQGEDAKDFQERIRTLTLGIGGLERLAKAAAKLPNQREAEKADNEKIADILDRLNRRIVALAKAYAKDLVAEGRVGEIGETGGENNAGDAESGGQGDDRDDGYRGLRRD